MSANCPRCGSPEVIYTGIDDGGGDYGAAVCDNYTCNECDYGWEENCVEYFFPDFEADNDDPPDDPYYLHYDKDHLPREE